MALCVGLPVTAVRKNNKPGGLQQLLWRLKAALMVWAGQDPACLRQLPVALGIPWLVAAPLQPPPHLLSASPVCFVSFLILFLHVTLTPE